MVDRAMNWVDFHCSSNIEASLLERQRDGRAFRYSPVLTEPELVATRMTKALDVATDREATLSRFVQELSEGDEALLRAVLDGDA